MFGFSKIGKAFETISLLIKFFSAPLSTMESPLFLFLLNSVSEIVKLKQSFAIIPFSASAILLLTMTTYSNVLGLTLLIRILHSSL